MKRNQENTQGKMGKGSDVLFMYEDLVSGLNCSRGVLVEFQRITPSCSVGHIACREEKIIK